MSLFQSNRKAVEFLGLQRKNSGPQEDGGERVTFYQGVEIRTLQAGAPASGRVGLAQEEGTWWIDGEGWSLVSDGPMAPCLTRRVMNCSHQLSSPSVLQIVLARTGPWTRGSNALGLVA